MNNVVQLIPLIEFIKIFLILFLFGVWGVFVIRRNLLIMLISLEIILFAVNLSLIVFSVYHDDYVGQVFGLVVLTVAACESAIGLAILVVYYRLRGLIDVNLFNILKG